MRTFETELELSRSVIDRPVMLTVAGMLVTGFAFTRLRVIRANPSAVLPVLAVGVIAFVLTMVIADVAEERRQDRWRAEQAAVLVDRWGIRVVDEAELPGGRLLWAHSTTVDIGGRTTFCLLTALRRDADTGMWSSPADGERRLGRQLKLRLDCPKLRE